MLEQMIECISWPFLSFFFMSLTTPQVDWGAGGNCILSAKYQVYVAAYFILPI